MTVAGLTGLSVQTTPRLYDGLRLRIMKLTMAEAGLLPAKWRSTKATLARAGCAGNAGVERVEKRHLRSGCDGLMPRSATPVVLDPQQRTALTALVRADSTPQKLASRARIVLPCADGLDAIPHCREVQGLETPCAQLRQRAEGRFADVLRLACARDMGHLVNRNWAARQSGLADGCKT